MIHTPFLRPRWVPALLLAVAVCSLSRPYPAAAAADDLLEMRSFVEAGIASNLKLVHSFDVQVQERRGSCLDTGGPPYLERDVSKTIRFDGRRWFQRVSTTGPDLATGKLYPYESESVFDGDRTIRHDKRGHSATIYAGNAMESRPSRDLACGYTFLMWPLPSTLRFAKTIERTEVNGKSLVRIVLPSDRTPDRVTTLWLDPAAGFLIVRAEGRDGQGRVFSERVETETKQAGGAWFLTRGTDHLWGFKGEEKRTLESISWTATLATVNRNVAPELLDLTLPPGTLVRDDLTGQITKAPAMPAAPAAPGDAPQTRPAGGR